VNTKRLKVLIIAHEFSPIKGSESAVGWNLATRLCKYHDVTVFYASGSQFRDNSYVEVINNYFHHTPPIEGLTCINIDKPFGSKMFARVNSFFKKLTPIGLPVLYYLGYKHWQKSVFRKGKALHQSENFDIVHQLTQITFREPGYMWKLGIPFFWGPTGGTVSFPKKFRKEISTVSKILTSIRSVSNYYQFRFVPRIAKANRKASVIYCFSKKDAERLAKRAHGQVKIMLDVGTYPRPRVSVNSSADEPFLKGIWCGRLSDFKAPSILLRALAMGQHTRQKIKFTVIGIGALEQSMMELAKELELENIEWIKEVKHAAVFDMMAKADFFVHTSIQEATSSVIMEALTMGLPVICHDAFGMSIAINDNCGIKVPFISPEESVKGFHNAMEKLLLNRDLLKELKIGALKRATEMSWDVMGETIANDYVAEVNKAAPVTTNVQTLSSF
jgi:glycosyltransferase involved in cell wall biosynthesis